MQIMAATALESKSNLLFCRWVGLKIGDLIIFNPHFVHFRDSDFGVSYFQALMSFTTCLKSLFEISPLRKCVVKMRIEPNQSLWQPGKIEKDLERLDVDDIGLPENNVSQNPMLDPQMSFSTMLRSTERRSAVNGSRLETPN